MNRLLLLPFLVGWIGLTLALGELRWFGRPTLADRLRPFAPASAPGSRAAGLLSVESLRDVIGPLAVELGRRGARLLGRGDDLAERLERVHATVTPTEVRVRQLGWALGAFGGALFFALGLGVPTAAGLVMVSSAPVLAFLVIEQQTIARSTAWQRRVEQELPVVSEQLGMLLSSGYSLGAAIARLASRGRGACARDLGLVSARIRQGLSEIDALREWAARVDVDAVHRLVAILALHRTAGDLGSLISEEATAIRNDSHRRLVEVMERRSQQVWIPVTVATLVPGVLFLAVPFIQALRLFTGD